MGGAYPLSQGHFTVFFAGFSPFEKVIHIGTEPVFERFITSPEANNEEG